MKKYYITTILLSILVLYNAAPDELKIRGENLRISDSNNNYFLSGNVVVEGEDFVLLSDSIRISRMKEYTLIDGISYILSDTFLLKCEQAKVYKEYNILKLYNLEGVALKLHLAPETYIALDRGDLLNRFEYRMRLKARYIKRFDEDRFYAEDIKYTICNCKENNTWELLASRLYYERNGYLLSLSNLIYLHGIPSMYIPAILFPVGERRSGFLIPEIGFNSTMGYSLRNAYYQTLGVSADTTLYLTLMSRKGEMYTLEFRYRPLSYLYGKTMFSYAIDESNRDLRRRFNLKNEHRLNIEDRIIMGFNTNIVSDSLYMSDYLFDFWERNTEYNSSRFYTGYNQKEALIQIESDYYQNFKKGLKREEFNFFSDTGNNESQRLPFFRISILPQRLILDTDVMLEATYVNYYSLYSDYREFDYYGRLLTYDKNLKDILNLNRYTITIPFHSYILLGDVLDVNQVLETTLRNYQIPDMSYNFATSVYRLNSGIPLYRRYERFSHLIRAELEYKNLFYAEYTKDWKLYNYRVVAKDEYDNYTKAQYLLLHLNNFLYSNSSSQEVFGLDIAQGFQRLRDTHISPLLLNIDINLNYFKGSADLYLFWAEKDPYYDTSSQSTIIDKRGDSITLRYQRYKNYLENPDTIFNREFYYLIPAYYKCAIEDITISSNLSITREISAGYFITYSIENERLLFHGGSLNYHSRCNCLNAGITAVMYQWYEFPAFITTFNLGGNI